MCCIIYIEIPVRASLRLKARDSKQDVGLVKVDIPMYTLGESPPRFWTKLEANSPCKLLAKSNNIH